MIPSATASPAEGLGLGRALLSNLHARFGEDAFTEYFATFSAAELRDILLGFDPQTLLIPYLDHDELVDRMAWFAKNRPLVRPVAERSDGAAAAGAP